ncbi:hypothetical protein GSI_06991 [Ganoderma sinense ZZ0214-1]|uniref:Uncharacterized protein n=1 Tax=Ganoderma sinense ZZ0214-1 TaxID=1077348 RepID=A0A2G8SAN6_9APHY|nr:hypothetical protein GSI_06991 [Ganoderma sinense ZZ0214-1]
MEAIALWIAAQWHWSEDRTITLQKDLKTYRKCEAPFQGGQADALEWWTNLNAPTNNHLLKALAMVLYSIVPHPKPGIDTNLADNLEENFSWVPPMTVKRAVEDPLEGPKELSLAELDTAFDEFEVQLRTGCAAHKAADKEEGRWYGEVLTGEVYSFAELEKVDQEVIPRPVREEVQAVGQGVGNGAGWTVEQLMGRAQ